MVEVTTLAVVGIAVAGAVIITVVTIMAQAIIIGVVTILADGLTIGVVTMAEDPTIGEVTGVGVSGSALDGAGLDGVRGGVPHTIRTMRHPL